MQKKAHFYFYGSLNDFLKPIRQSPVVYYFNDVPAVKDAIEAIGVPHTEVDAIFINQQPVSFLHALYNQDTVEVYPVHYAKPPGAQSLSKNFDDCKFILDVHLGKLVRLMRLLGIDSIYQNNYDDTTIARIAQEQNRIVLTRDINLLKHKVIKSGYWLRSQFATVQLMEVVNRFGLQEHFKPFSRCIACNGIIKRVAKEVAAETVPPNALQYFDEYYQCNSCKRIYWKGSHYDKMEQTLENIRQQIKK